ncbi:hypothetical protein IG631_23367 [Alternaria alternata]|nr:hypothetical protein IG631_23367 [Alternaria alternata]
MSGLEDPKFLYTRQINNDAFLKHLLLSRGFLPREQWLDCLDAMHIYPVSPPVLRRVTETSLGLNGKENGARRVIQADHQFLDSLLSLVIILLSKSLHAEQYAARFDTFVNYKSWVVITSNVDSRSKDARFRTDSHGSSCLLLSFDSVSATLRKTCGELR